MIRSWFRRIRGGAPLPLALAVFFTTLATGCTGDVTSDSATPPAVTMRRVSRKTNVAANANDVDPGDPGDPGEDDADARNAWLDGYFGTDPPLSYLQYRARIAAAEAKKVHQMRAFATTATGSWTNLGPFAGAVSPSDDGVWADAGRLTAIVTHPTNNQIVYIAGDGGVFKSTNADPASTTDWTWTAITDNLPASSAAGNIAVGDLAMSPTDPNTLYLGLGDPLWSQSVGFFVTHDGGSTWTASTGLGTVTQVSQILPVNGSVVLVATPGNGLWRSTDGAKTFTQLSVAGSVNGSFYSLGQFGNGTIVVYDGNTARALYSTNQGATWTPATMGTNPIGTLTVAHMALGGGTSTVGYMLASAQSSTGVQMVPGVLKTTNSGHSWTYVTPSGPSFDLGQPQYNMLITVDPTNANNLWVGTQISLSRSMDGGVTWTNASNWLMHADYHVAAWAKTGAKTLYIGNDGGLAVMRDPLRATPPSTTDLTYVDNRHNRGVASHLIYNLSSTAAPAPADGRYHVSIGTQDNGTRFRTDSGSGLATSGLFDTAAYGDGFGTYYHPYVVNEVLGSINGNLYRTSDGTTLAFPVSPGQLLFGVPVIPDASDVTGNSVLTLGSDALYRSRDFGLTFTTVPQTGVDPSFFRYHAAVAATDGNTMAIVGDNVAPSPGYITTNGGASWTKMGATDSSSYARSVWIDSRNASIIYVTSVTQDPTVHHIYKSTDKGATFAPIDSTTNGLPFGLPVLAVKNDPFDSNTVYAATDLGMYKSSNGGTSWTRFGTGLPLVRVTDFWIAPDDSVMRVGTYGRGVWEIALSGHTANTLTASITSPSADQSVAGGSTVNFTGSATDSGGTSTMTGIWYFGDGTTATGLTASHAFTNSGTTPVTYTVTFIARDASGGSAGAVRNVTVGVAPDFSIGLGPIEACHFVCRYAIDVPQGGSTVGSATVNLVAGDPQTVSLSVTSQLPPGVTVTFNPTTVSTGASATMTITASGSVAPGSYAFSVTGVGQSGSHTESPQLIVTSTTPASPITNGDFETGDLSAWTTAGSTSVVASGAHGGTHAAELGTTGATSGDSSIAQTFTAPSTGGTLGFWYAIHCDDTVSYDWATATLKDNTAGTTATVLAKKCSNTGTWTQATSALTGGHSYTLTLISHDDGYAGDPTYTLYDDVTVTATTPPPPQSLQNGDFESGSLSPWTVSGSAAISSTAHAGTHAALTGLSGQPTTGDSSVAQTFTASAAGTLGFWYRVVCKDTVTYDWATATLKDNTAGTTATILPKKCSNTGAWTQVTTSVVANHSYTLTLTNHDDGYAGDETYTWYDDVTLN